jgi:hypothetical protein
LYAVSASFKQEQEGRFVVPNNKETLFHVAQWIATSKRRVGRQIRQLVETEEECTLILTELYRVEDHLRRARSLRARATLTLVDWFTILEHFEWRCAYCQSEPFQVLLHILPQEVAGTTPENCVPACRHCKCSSKRECTHVMRYLAILHCQQAEQRVQVKKESSHEV